MGAEGIMKRRIYTTITNQEFYELLKEGAEQGTTNWTINQNAQVGDIVCLYVKAPTSAIVAVAIIETKPELCENPQSPWFGSYFAEMHSLYMLTEPMTRDFLIEAFPIWRYWRQPRTSSRVPDPFVNRMADLIKLFSPRIDQ
jgi:hypothetical protein